MVLRVKIYYRALCRKLRHLARTVLAVEEKRISYPDPDLQLFVFSDPLTDLTTIIAVFCLPDCGTINLLECATTSAHSAPTRGAPIWQEGVLKKEKVKLGKNRSSPFSYTFLKPKVPCLHKSVPDPHS